MDVFRVILFFVSLIIAAYNDLKYRKIPNWLTLSVTAAGFILAFYINGAREIIFSLLGWVIGFMPFYFVYKKGGLGAGDVKLMGMVGALGGPRFIIMSYFYTSITGFIMAFIKLSREKQIKNGFARSVNLLGKFLGFSAQDIIDDKTDTLTIPYGLAIVVGSYLAFFSVT